MSMNGRLTGSKGEDHAPRARGSGTGRSAGEHGPSHSTAQAFRAREVREANEARKSLTQKVASYLRRAKCDDPELDAHRQTLLRRAEFAALFSDEEVELARTIWLNRR